MQLSWFTTDIAHLLIAIGGIILVDISLSGDNALVIGAAVSRLPSHQRRIALLWGGLFAAVLRIALTGIASKLLLIPLLQAAGGAVIFVIAIRMLIPEAEVDADNRRASDRLLPAILSIFAADVTMSLDNVLAIGALARGNLPLLIFGLLMSVALLLLASALLAAIIGRFWWLRDLTALILSYLAAQLVLTDPIVSHVAMLTSWRATALLVGSVLTVGLSAVGFRLAQQRERRHRARMRKSRLEQDARDTDAPDADEAAQTIDLD